MACKAWATREHLVSQKHSKGMLSWLDQAYFTEYDKLYRSAQYLTWAQAKIELLNLCDTDERRDMFARACRAVDADNATWGQPPMRGPPPGLPNALIVAQRAQQTPPGSPPPPPTGSAPAGAAPLPPPPGPAPALGGGGHDVAAQLARERDQRIAALEDRCDHLAEQLRDAMVRFGNIEQRLSDCEMKI